MWHYVEMEVLAHVFPAEGGHGKRNKKGDWVMEDGITTCQCNPTLQLGTYEEGEWCEFKKPLVAHNSFTLKRRLNKHLKSIGL